MITGCCIRWPKECKAIRIFISQPDWRGDLKSTLAFNTHLVFYDLSVCQSFSRLVFLSLYLFLKYESDYMKLTIRSRLVSLSFIFLEKISVRASCRVNSNYHDFFSFGFLLSPPRTQHTHRCTPHTSAHTEIQRCTLTRPRHSRRFQMRGTVVMPQATQYCKWLLCSTSHFICLSYLRPTTFQCVAVCTVCMYIYYCWRSIHRWFLFDAPNG